MKSVEAKLNAALDEVEAFKRIVSALKVEIYRLRLRDAQTELEERIAALPTDAKERLRKAFPDVFLGGLKQAVKVEKRRGE